MVELVRKSFYILIILIIIIDKREPSPPAGSSNGRQLSYNPITNPIPNYN